MTDLSWLIARPIAHRGFHDKNRTRWENTLSAFDAAIERDYAIECDSHLSSDGVPVVIHDDDLKRLTGEDGFVWQRTAAELGAMRIGGTEDHVPTLEEVEKAHARMVAGGYKESATLGEHVNDEMTSFYVQTPGGFDLEIGCNGLVIDPATWEVTAHDKVSKWGHVWAWQTEAAQGAA